MIALAKRSAVGEAEVARAVRMMIDLSEGRSGAVRREVVLDRLHEEGEEAEAKEPLHRAFLFLCPFLFLVVRLG